MEIGGNPFFRLEHLETGDSGWLLVELGPPKWHMYWKMQGVWLSTSIEWSGDEVDFGSLQFPKPKKYEFLEMVIYVHEASFVLLTEISLDKDTYWRKSFDKGNLSTLICSEDNCIPFDTIAIEIPVAKESSEIKKSWTSSSPPRKSGQRLSS